MFDKLKTDLYEALKQLAIFTTKLDDFTKKLEKTAETVDKLSERVVAVEAGREAFKQATLREFEQKLFEITYQVREKLNDIENRMRVIESRSLSVDLAQNGKSNTPLISANTKEE